MSPSPSHRHASVPPSPEAIVQEALGSQDGLHIGSLLRQLETLEAPSDLIARSVRDIAHAHPEMTPVVIGCLSILERMRSSELRPLCRLIVNAPFDPDRDLIIANAASLLAQQPDPQSVDVLLLARAVHHRSEHVKTCTRCAISNLSPRIADKLHARASELPEKPQLLMLKRLLRKEGPLSPLIMPPAPTRKRQGPKELPLRAPRAAPPTKTPQRHTPRVSTPVKEAQALSGRKPVQQPDVPPKPTPGDRLATLHPHRLPEYHLLTESALSNIATLSKNYRDVAAALAEYTVRFGASQARRFTNRLVYALTDPANTEKSRFEDLSHAWFASID
jgi:hypothetical protein